MATGKPAVSWDYDAAREPLHNQIAYIREAMGMPRRTTHSSSCRPTVMRTKYRKGSSHDQEDIPAP
jgi:hypothetical protein